MLKAAILTVLSEIRVTVSLGVRAGVIVGVGVGVISRVGVAVPVAVEVGDNDTLFTLSSMQPENSIIAAITNRHEMVLPVMRAHRRTANSVAYRYISLIFSLQ